MYTVFISDLHLSERHPEGLKDLDHLLAHYQGQLDALYILGDLFEYWLGDDLCGPVALGFAERMQTLHAQKTPIYFMAGNRDFLLGNSFLQRFGGQLLPDPSIVTLYQQQKILLTHGDQLNRADIPYLRYRRFVHQHWVQSFFLSLPKTWREKIALFLRQKSKQQQPRQPIYPDPITTDILHFMDQTSEFCQILIHGHTHFPVMQLLYDPDNTKIMLQRLVLSDWHPKQANALQFDRHQQYQAVYLNS